ncbi:MAG: ammonium transporter [Cyanobacteria bacterium M_surface_7_m2_037]|nr:ammonium transporter [Cyanobacteria bacterium K_DeepCast_0m_m1_088]MBM5795061.1 ammonium transporter [Cyanobacteria bacterium M_surface_7_m2_037]MBM5818824.1 ammonium transporter [Cyanobacteria bacterium K_DeepCast_150m_m2_101]
MGSLLPVHAADAAALNPADNTLVLMSSALVLLMTPGLAFFYGGFVQGRNVLNTMAMSFVMMGIATVVWATFGFSLAFAEGGAWQAVLGNPLRYALLENLPPSWEPLAIPGLSFALFQGMFAIITPALISGALVERISFRFWCLFTPIWLLLVYAPLAHMVWGGGLLGKDLDFAGGTVVHISSGVSALVLAALIGARRQWPQSVRPPHDVTQILLGTGLLWFGWFGFNGGSQLTVAGAELPFTTTHVAAAAGLVAWSLLETWRDGKPTAVGMATGAVGGLVGITPAAGFVTVGSALAIGALTSLLCYISVQVKVKLRFDDSLDTYAVHGVGGTAGALLTGVFANAELIAAHPAGAVLAQQGRTALVLGQLQAVLVAYGLAALGTLLIAAVLRGLGVRFRVSENAENLGVDVAEHGEEAYAERVGSPQLF